MGGISSSVSHNRREPLWILSDFIILTLRYVFSFLLLLSACLLTGAQEAADTRAFLEIPLKNYKLGRSGLWHLLLNRTL